MAYCVHCGAPVAEGAAYCPTCGKSPTAPPAARKKSGSTVAAVVVIAAGGCLFLTAVIGIIAAILVPNFLDALQKAKQKRTMADMRDIAVVLESRGADQPLGVPPYPDVASISELAPLLERYTAGPVPTFDAWEGPFRYQCASAPGVDGCTAYRLGSAGRDGVFEHDDLFTYDSGTFPPTDYDGDIVIESGTFIRWPQQPPP